MRVHRIARLTGYSAFVEANGYGPSMTARLRIVRDVDNVVVYSPRHMPHSPRTVAQWAHELAHALIAEVLPPSHGRRGDASQEAPLK